MVVPHGFQRDILATNGTDALACQPLVDASAVKKMLAAELSELVPYPQRLQTKGALTPLGGETILRRVAFLRCSGRLTEFGWNPSRQEVRGRIITSRGLLLLRRGGRRGESRRRLVLVPQLLRRHWRRIVFIGGTPR